MKDLGKLLRKFKSKIQIYNIYNQKLIQKILNIWKTTLKTKAWAIQCVPLPVDKIYIFLNFSTICNLRARLHDEKKFQIFKICTEKKLFLINNHVYCLWRYE